MRQGVLKLVNMDEFQVVVFVFSKFNDKFLIGN